MNRLRIVPFAKELIRRERRCSESSGRKKAAEALVCATCCPLGFTWRKVIISIGVDDRYCDHVAVSRRDVYPRLAIENRLLGTPDIPTKTPITIPAITSGLSHRGNLIIALPITDRFADDSLVPPRVSGTKIRNGYGLVNRVRPRQTFCLSVTRYARDAIAGLPSPRPSRAIRIVRRDDALIAVSARRADPINRARARRDASRSVRDKRRAARLLLPRRHVGEVIHHEFPRAAAEGGEVHIIASRGNAAARKGRDNNRNPRGDAQ